MSDYICTCTSLTSAADKRLRSSSRNLLLVPRSSAKFGDCSFSIAGTTEWSSLPAMRRTHHLWRHLNRPASSKPIFSYDRITDKALWESSMKTYIHSRIYKLRGSPAWKHTITLYDIGL